MKGPRVNRSAGPKSKMTKANYRKKALRFLLKDFQGCCAYCLDPSDFRHPQQNHVDHFDCKLKERQRHQYKNLMLACVTCNSCKHDKPVINPLDQEQRLLNCTIENEFPEHIVEIEEGQWKPITKQGEYHLESIGLTESCHQRKRFARRINAEWLLRLCTTAIQYKTHNPAEVQSQLMNIVSSILALLDSFPPLVTQDGVVTVRKWLAANGVDIKLFQSSPTSGDIETSQASGI